MHPVFIFLIEALCPISCKNLNKFFKNNIPKTYFLQPFLDLATLHVPYVTNTPANRCHGKVNYVFKPLSISMSMYYNCCNAFCTMHSPPLSPFCVTYLNNFSSLNEIYLIYHSVIPCMFNILLYSNG